MNTLKLSRTLHIPLAMAGMMALLIFLVGVSKHNTDSMVGKYAPQVTAVLEVRQQVTLGHLWLEEILYGDEHESAETVLEHFSTARWYTRSLLHGGENDWINIAPLDDREARRVTGRLGGLVTALNEQVRSRLASPELSAPGSVVDEQFDDAFDNILFDTMQVEKRLRWILQQNLSRFQDIQALLILLIIFATIIIGAILYRNQDALIESLGKEKEANTALQNSEARFRDIALCGGDWIWEVDAQGRYTFSSDTVEKLIGYTPEEVFGHTPFDFMPPGEAQRVGVHFKSLFSSKSNIVELENWNLAKDGTLLCLSTTGVPIMDTSGEVQGYRGIDRDITLHKQREQLILKQAHFDNLTELPNRFLSLDRLSHVIEEARRDMSQVSVMFLDLDDFKKVNDTMGHAVGDELLIQAARRLERVVRSGDTVGRLGGDEFVIILGGMSVHEDSRIVAQKLLLCFQEPFELQQRQLTLTASIGIACYPSDGDQADELLRKADTAMYHSKTRGRNTYQYFTTTMNKQVTRRLAVEEALHNVLQQEELKVEYQPQIDLATNTCVGVEALLRWHNTKLGQVPPSEFISVAEHTGLIVSIGRYVLVESLKSIASLRKATGRELRVAVNVSPEQCWDPGLIGFVEESLHQTGVPASALELEITENVLLSGHEDMVTLLGALSDLGVSIAMDDFGTGYSSLNNLRGYPFDTLKIDRSFVQNIIQDSADGKLVKATIAMAHSLGLKVIAEGVETELQLEFLRQHQCDYVQGFLLGRPVPAGELWSCCEKNYT